MKFEQTDENEYTLAIPLEDLVAMSDGIRDGEVRLMFRTHVGEELYELVRAVFDDYIAVRDEARSSWEAQKRAILDRESECDLLAPDDPKRADYAERMRAGADLGRKAERENRH